MTSPTPHVDSTIENPLAISATSQSRIHMNQVPLRLSPAEERDREKFLIESQQKKEEHLRHKQRMANIYNAKVKFFHNNSMEKPTKHTDSKGFSLQNGRQVQESQAASGLNEVTSFGALLQGQAASFDTRNPKLSEIVNIGSAEHKDHGDSLNNLPSP
mmetsp:Transcript_40811/g.62243  ORF Transcript_40811/g.62243 Transcript_40811/m.62243 type:complete len:158 (+) Transcript_40811:106-579(+)